MLCQCDSVPQFIKKVLSQCNGMLEILKVCRYQKAQGRLDAGDMSALLEICPNHACVCISAHMHMRPHTYTFPSRYIRKVFMTLTLTEVLLRLTLPALPLHSF